MWLIVNWMLIDGLQRSWRVDLAARIRHDSLALVERAGFAEYFNPLTGEPLGGSAFSWTAAMYLHLALKANRNIPLPRSSPTTEIAAPARQKFADAPRARWNEIGPDRGEGNEH